MRLQLTALALLLATPLIHAHATIHYYIRDLTALADIIVVADIIDVPNADPDECSFKVVEVVLGKGVAVGDTIKLQWCAVRFKNPENYNLPTPKLSRALLYLESAAARAAKSKSPLANPYSLVTSGERYLSADNIAYMPTTGGGKGEALYWNKYENNITWDKLLDHARAEAKAFAPVKDLIASPGSPERNKALFDWIAQHKSEFQFGYIDRTLFNRTDFDTVGWGDLELATFEAIAKSKIPEDAWNAVLQVAAIMGNFRDYQDRLDPSVTFSSKAGRKYLLARTADLSIPAEHRVFAFETFLDGAVSPRRLNAKATEPATDAEREDLYLDLIKPLQDPAAPVRANAARTIGYLYNYNDLNPRPNMLLARPVVEALAQAYKTEPLGIARTWIAQTLYPNCTEIEWKEITGNPGRRLATVRLLHKLFKPSDPVHIIMEYRSTLAPTSVPVRIKADRLDEQGRVVRKHTFDFSAKLSPNGNGHWYLEHKGPLLIEAGNWRIYATSTAGENEAIPWTSEAFSFEIKESMTRNDIMRAIK